jgi:hypothetical protein
VEVGAVLRDFLRIQGRSDVRQRALRVMELARTESGSLPGDGDREEGGAGESGVDHRSGTPGYERGLSPGDSTPGFSVFLPGSHRFSGELQDCSSAIRSGTLTGQFLERFRCSSLDDAMGRDGGVVYLSSDDVDLDRLIGAWTRLHYEAYRFSPDTALEVGIRKLNAARVLTPYRRGPIGVQSINGAIIEIIRPWLQGTMDWFAGMPLMLQKNDNIRRLYNGDTGIVAPSRDGDSLVAHFPSGAGTDSRHYQRQSIPEFEPAFCHTVHKSQGSEYDEVLVTLLPGPGSISRELVYTAVTRARKKCILYGPSDHIADVCSRVMMRETGLERSVSH